jgi:hypothetical protein
MHAIHTVVYHKNLKYHTVRHALLLWLAEEVYRNPVDTVSV